MVDSDKSDNGESQTAKRLREDNSGDEKCELPSKKLRSKSPEHVESVDNKKDPIVQVTNGGAINSEDKIIPTNVKEESKNGKDIATDDDNEENPEEKDPADNKMEVIESIEKTKDEAAESEDENKEIIKKEMKADADNKYEEQNGDEPSPNKSQNLEVVDGLELSVECASDKEASSSESDREKETKPRPKTIIVKAKPNDSEVEVGSSEAEKSETDDKIEEDKDVRSKQKRMEKKKSSDNESSSQSEQSLESNSEDDDYSPRTKKKLRKVASPPKKAAKPQKGKAKKAQERKKKSVTESEDDESESEDEEMTLADRAKKITDKHSEKKDEEVGESKSESENDAASSDESDDKNKKNGKRAKRSNDPNDNKLIKSLKKYVTLAGLRVKYEELWAGCRSNAQRANRIKELLRKNGLEGRPSIEKCKKIKIKNATQKEVAELDTSNIISEGRVTRARRIEANNKANLVTPSKRRDARNLFKRIQPVCDSDTE